MVADPQGLDDAARDDRLHLGRQRTDQPTDAELVPIDDQDVDLLILQAVARHRAPSLSPP